MSVVQKWWLFLCDFSKYFTNTKCNENNSHWGLTVHWAAAQTSVVFYVMHFIENINSMDFSF